MVWQTDINYVVAEPNFEFEFGLEEASPYRWGWQWGLGRRAIKERVPTSALQTDRKKLVDVFPLGGCFAVSAKFRQIIETFEPGIHEFHPVDLIQKGGASYDLEYFIINVCQRFDSILLSNSKVDWGYVRAESLLGMPYVSSIEGLRCVSKSMISGNHLWLNDFIFPGKPMISNELRNALMENRITRLLYNEPWSIAYDEIDYPFRYGEQMPNLISWIEENKPDYLVDTRHEWLKQHVPHMYS